MPKSQEVRLRSVKEIATASANLTGYILKCSNGCGEKKGYCTVCFGLRNRIHVLEWVLGKRDAL